ncbi:GNAT family N-acetyltransferase [Ruegeria hyattellae]|uniref:GNAT family N-acetyltransferase n=1 Tax=Ruegeria hyattellae TaxID=3233337 RepID=UPI00355B2BAF
MAGIRPLRPDDFEEVIKIWHDGWHNAHANIVPKGALRYRTIECFWSWLHCSSDKLHVAVDDRVLGFVSTQGSELVKLYVGPNARGSGIATELLSYGETEILKQGIAEAVLFCTAGNTRAQRFYDREGWTLTKTFADRLWLPDGVSGEFVVDTHQYSKQVDGRSA